MLSAIDRHVAENQVTQDAKNKRILWLINHTTLREFEVPLLRSFGFEIYTPKCIPALIYEWSGSVDHSHDETLTIPQNILAELNDFNFYEDPITPRIAELLNQYFSVAFCVFYPAMLDQITKYFEGKILLRAFGLDEKASYTKIMQDLLGRDFIERLQSIKSRFWFAQAYDNLDEVECEILKSKTITLSLGLPQSFYKYENSWTGEVKKILFFCSRIVSSAPYYGKIYSEFKKHFNDFPYLVAGNQPEPVDDHRVAGLQPRNVIDEWLRTFAVLFYHSQEPRHLHYHPLEAMIVGTPVVYLRGGILEKLGGDYQPGACHNYQEARKKIRQILQGDQTLINDIRKYQKIILEKFSLNYNLLEWETKFVKQILQVPSNNHLHLVNKPIKTIAVFLPVGYRGGSFNGAKNIAKMIYLGSRLANEPVNVVFSCEANSYDLKRDFADLYEYNIPVRETTWTRLGVDKVKFLQKLLRKETSLTSPFYSAPMDGINNFHDCDFWLSVSDRFLVPLAPIKPYGLVVYDYIQRYVPEILSKNFDDINYIITARNAEFVLTTTPSTRDDAIQYAGLNPNRVHLAPMEFNTFKKDNEFIHTDENYFLWPSNSSQHKNHLNTIEALDIYYREHKGKLKAILTGYMTERFILDKNNPETFIYFKDIINLIQGSEFCKKNLIIKGYVSVSEYINLLVNAKFLLHPTFIDNGTYSVIEAAYHGVPAVSSSYPQMKFIDERFKLNLMYFDAYSPKDIALKLKSMEEQYDQRKEELPDKYFLDQFSYEKTSLEFWKMVKSLI